MGFLYRPLPGLDRYPMVSEPSPAYPDVAGNHLLLLLREGLTHSQYYYLAWKASLPVWQHVPTGELEFPMAVGSFEDLSHVAVIARRLAGCVCEVGSPA